MSRQLTMGQCCCALQNICKALTDLLVVCLKHSLAHDKAATSSTANSDIQLQGVIIHWLFKPGSSSTHQLYFGRDAFPLTVRWLMTYTEARKLAGSAAMDCSHLEVPFIPKGYLTMLGAIPDATALYMHTYRWQSCHMSLCET